MPGMMDTVLNLGLNDRSVQGLARATGNERFAWDCYRRFVQMFANVVRGVSGEQIEDQITQLKARHRRPSGHGARRRRAARADRDLQAPLPRTDRRSRSRRSPADQLNQAIRAVFDSWSGERAVSYRRINHIPDEWGTAVNVQQMVFGNKGETLRRRGSRSAATSSPAHPSPPATS